MELRTPRLSGYALASLARLARSRAGGTALRGILRAELKVGQLTSLPDALRADLPPSVRPLQARPPRTPEDAGLPVPGGNAWAGTSESFTVAYRDGMTTPRAVVERALDAARELASRNPSVGPLLDIAASDAMAAAEASTKRWKNGRALGPLDGVPCAVKEQTAVRGLPRKSGASYSDPSVQKEDATIVARLRDRGAIPLGTTPMTEWGMNPFGCSPHRTLPRNPHGTDCIAGGSSTGSGVAVATGLVPYAMGADGGGSIRIPAALNGVFGIKPTWGRVSRHGDSSVDSVSHLGPLASSTLDLARVLEVIGAPDAADPQTERAPALPGGSLERALGRGVKGLRIGVEEREWRDAPRGIAKACEAALEALEKAGARMTKVQIPLARYAAAIGYVTIGLEILAGHRAEWRDHRDEFGPDLQVGFSTLSTLSGLEVLDAVRLRGGLRRQAMTVFGEIDLLALPSTATTAAQITATEMTSFLDPSLLDAICRYTFLGNLTGLPAASVPVGKDAHGLPIGFQLVGDAWDEATVLAACAHLERLGVARAERPPVAVDVLRLR
ncbi:MAG TPA: amidase [Polyangiaceae bacterium]|jgi:aspartyl-tRNA(Asn)/glutamyl-tRNA(Gln) amidotransferase subunit A